MRWKPKAFNNCMTSIKTTLFLLLLAAGSARAQSFSFGDLFGQAKKQKQYYLQQIAAYQAFRAELKQGYAVISNGLSGIRDIDLAELNAHEAYYRSLARPSASVSGSSQVQDILDWQGAIRRCYQGQDDPYVNRVGSGVLDQCRQDLEVLNDLLTSGKWQLDDAERLRRLEALHQSMLDKYTFSRGFCQAAHVLQLQRQQENRGLQRLKQVYENH